MMNPLPFVFGGGFVFRENFKRISQCDSAQSIRRGAFRARGVCYFFLYLPSFQASKNCFQASGLKIFIGGVCPMW